MHTTDEQVLQLEAKDLPRAIEAILLCATEPVAELLLAELCEFPIEEIRSACEDLSKQLSDRNAGFELVHVGGGWRYQTLTDLADVLSKFALSGQSQRISTAALETLSIIAYKQPVSRGQISAIRGVSVDGVIKTLEQRGYIAELGEDAGPGRATLYGTTQFFCETLGINSPKELPALGEFVPSAEVLEILEKSLTTDAETDTAEAVEVDPEIVLEESEVEAPEASVAS